MLCARVRSQASALVILGLLGFLAILLFSWTIPPITDLPAHLNQINAFWWSLKHPDGLYQINWLAPNTFYYYILLLLDITLPLLIAGKVMWLAIMAFQLSALAALQRRLKTPFLLFLFSCLFSFSLNFYWGFGNFIIAYSFFLWYIQINFKNKFFLKLILSIFIAWSHVFFLIPLAIFELRQWIKSNTIDRQWKSWIPFIIVSFWILIWIIINFIPKSSGKFEYNFSILSRISINWLISSIQGSIQGWIEPIITILILTLLFYIKAIEQKVCQNEFQKTVYFMAITLFLIGLLFPDKGMNTVRASQRWVPMAFQLLLISAPWPSREPFAKLFRATITLCSILFLGATYRAWSAFQSKDLLGLESAISVVPKGARLLVLDFVGFGENFQTRAAMHAGTLAGFTHGAIAQFSFADNPAGFVRFTQKRPYTPLLEWYPDRVQLSDLDQSDMALVGGSSQLHESMLQSGRLQLIYPVDELTTWRCYAVIKSDK